MKNKMKRMMKMKMKVMKTSKMKKDKVETQCPPASPLTTAVNIMKTGRMRTTEITETE